MSERSGRVGELPDEDTFTVPASWRRLLHPRRGGTPGSALKVDREVAWRLVAEVRSSVDDLLQTIHGDRQVLDDAAAYLRSCGAEATPDGAAVTATLVHKYLTEGTAWRRAGELAAFVDTWVADHGLVFAVRAVVAYQRIGIGWEGSPFSPQYQLAHLEGVKSGAQRDDCPLASRLRAHLAAADEPDHQAAVEALAECRHDWHPLLGAFLVPERADWVADACAAVSDIPTILLSAISSVDVLDARIASIDSWTVTRDTRTLPTLVEALGPAVAPALAHWVDEEYLEAATAKRLLAALAVLPTDEAFEILVARLDKKYVRPALLEAMKRFPVRATRLLAKASNTGDLLRTHVLGNRELLAAAGFQELVDRFGSTAPATTDPGTLPALLVDPPWTRKRTGAKPAVIEGLVPDTAVTVAWQPGEQEAWAATRGWVSPWLDHQKWPDAFEKYRAGNVSDHIAPAMFATGPEHLARPLLAAWRPTYLFPVNDWLKCIVARFEVDALPLAIHCAELNPATNATLLVPFANTEIAQMMTDWFGAKSVRKTALAWLKRHPRAAAHHLIPDALAKPGDVRRAAEAMLRLLPPDEVAAAAAGYGVETEIKTMLATDPLDLLPTRVPKIPEWAEPAALPPLVLRDGGALPATAAGHVVTMLAMSRPGEVYAGVDVVKQLCEPTSLAEFGWAVFQRWQAAGTPTKQNWTLDALGWLGDDETVRRLAPLIRAWPGEGGHKRAVDALDVLAEIGTEVALMHLHGIAQKVKFKVLKLRAQEKIAAVAADLSLTADQLADRLVPDLGLDAAGSLTLDYGPRRFTVGFDERLKPYVADEDGTRRKDLPKPGAADDQTLAPAAHARFAALKKDARTIATDQVRRLEQAMVNSRRWPAAEFLDLFVAHPLLWHIVRRLVWLAVDGATVTPFRVAEDRTFADVEDEVFTLPPSALVGIAHPLHLPVPEWATLFADYEILQPFPQLARPAHRLSTEEQTVTTLTRFENLKVPTGKLLGLTRRGWQRATPQDAGVEPWIMRPLPDNRAVVVNLNPGLAVGAPEAFEEQLLEHIWLSDTANGDWAPRVGTAFGSLDPVLASEVLADLTELTT